MTSPKNRLTRHTLAEFSQNIGKQVLNVRLFKEHAGYLCERELVESDGSAFTQALPFQSAAAVREFLRSDPHYEAFRKRASSLLNRLPSEVSHEFA